MLVPPVVPASPDSTPSHSETAAEPSEADSSSSSYSSSLLNGPGFPLHILSENEGRVYSVHLDQPGSYLSFALGGEEDWRIYVVWLVPEQEVPVEFTGIHWGSGLTPYSGILLLNKGKFTGLRWRRVFSVEEARNLFLREAEGHGVSGLPLTFYLWHYRQRRARPPTSA